MRIAKTCEPCLIRRVEGSWGGRNRSARVAMAVSPGGRSSPGFCHIPSQRNRPAQKQIICPIYRALLRRQPLQNGPGTGKFDKKDLLSVYPRDEAILIT